MTGLRSLPLDELVATLVSEHAKMKEELSLARTRILAEDFAGAKHALTDVVGTFRQHIADEEGQILRLLIEVYGKEGAQEAITIFRQHRPIYALMQAVEELSQLAAEELAERQAELMELLGSHAFSEERTVFPRALSARKTGPGGSRTQQV